MNLNVSFVFVETVKDLIRFLKREDESCDIRRQLGHAQILQNDLIPILKTYKDDRILWETITRLDFRARLWHINTWLLRGCLRLWLWTHWKISIQTYNILNYYDDVLLRNELCTLR